MERLECSETGCSRPSRSRGKCKPHYDEAYRIENRVRRNSSAAAYRAKNREELAAKQRDYLRARLSKDENFKDSEDFRLWVFGLRTKYGITPKDYLALLEKQGYMCALCLREYVPGGRRLAVDHDHDTGRVRGLLCSPCNATLGRWGDKLEGALRAVAYLSEPEADK